jgi:hypothetical protein
MTRKEVAQVGRETCYFCGSEGPIETHHVVPRRFDGEDADENLVDLCPTCHQRLERLYDDDTWTEIREYDPNGESFDTELDDDEGVALVGYIVYSLPETTVQYTQVRSKLEDLGIGESEAEYHIDNAHTKNEIVIDRTMDGEPRGLCAGRAVNEWAKDGDREPSDIIEVTKWCHMCESEYIPVLENEDGHEQCSRCGALYGNRRSDYSGFTLRDEKDREEKERQRERIRHIKKVIHEVWDEYGHGAPEDVVKERVDEEIVDPEIVDRDVERMKQKGDVYEPEEGVLRPT